MAFASTDEWGRLVVALVWSVSASPCPWRRGGPDDHHRRDLTDNKGKPVPGVTITFRNATGSTNTHFHDTSGSTASPPRPAHTR
jgi:hypothetical protein